MFSIFKKLSSRGHPLLVGDPMGTVTRIRGGSTLPLAFSWSPVNGPLFTLVRAFGVCRFRPARPCGGEEASVAFVGCDPTARCMPPPQDAECLSPLIGYLCKPGASPAPSLHPLEPFLCVANDLLRLRHRVLPQ